LGIGYTAARFVATLVLDRVKGAASRALLPYQFGMCVNGGAGYTYKIIQRKMEHDGAAVSLEDEACAFNYMDQEVMYDLRANALRARSKTVGMTIPRLKADYSLPQCSLVPGDAVVCRDVAHPAI
jgi:hypothetical protein